MTSPLLALAGGGAAAEVITGLQFNEYADAASATVSVNIGDYQSDRVVIILAIVSNDGTDYAEVMNMDGGTTEVSDTAFISSGGTVGPIFGVSDRGAFSGKTSININVTLNGSANVTRLRVASYSYYGGTATPDIPGSMAQGESSSALTETALLTSPTADFIFGSALAGESDLAYTNPSTGSQATYTDGGGSYMRVAHKEDPADTTSGRRMTVGQGDFNFLLLYIAKFNFK